MRGICDAWKSETFGARAARPVSRLDNGYGDVPLLAEMFEESIGEVRWTVLPSVQESAAPNFLHLLQGRYSEHLVFETLQRVHAMDVLFLLAFRRAISRFWVVTPDCIPRY